MMKTLLILLIAATLASAANIGDNAPPVPSTFSTSHPRLPAPGSAYLTALNSAPSSLSRFTTSALAYSASSAAYTSATRIGFRRLLIAYLACQLNTCANLSTYQASINTLADMGGMLGSLLAEDNTATGAGGVITSSTVNFTTACGGTCAGNYLAVLGVACAINSVTTTTATLGNCLYGQTAPAGSNLRIRLFSSSGFDGTVGTNIMYIAMLYDWCYQYLTPQQKTDLLNGLINLCSEWEWIEGVATIPTQNTPSPYNDVMYITSPNGPGLMSAAVAIYGDSPTAAPHLRYAMDLGFNYLLPVWKQIMLGDGNPSTDGGGWHEGWSEYQNVEPNGLHSWVLTWWLPWAYASNPSSPTAFFTTQNPWMKWYGYQTIYMMRPDYLLPKMTGGVGTGVYAQQEYDQDSGGANIGGADFGSIDGLAQIYNDPVLRYWNRLMNQVSRPDGFEPSAWPFFTPDLSGNTTTNINTLPLCHNFTGVGIVTCRTGWTENDTYIAIRYGDNFWSKPKADVGNYELVHRGTLVNDSSSYRAGTAAPHWELYGMQSIAANVTTLTDPADSFGSELFEVINSSGTVSCVPLANEGGQRRIGSGWQSYFSSSSCTGQTTNTWLDSFADTAGYQRSWEYMHESNLLAYVPLASTSGAYMYVAADITRSYNDVYSVSAPNANNRTQRAQKVVRHFVFIPRGHSAYVAVYDQVIEAPTLGSAIPMKWLLHTINQPTLGTDAGGNPMFTALRTDNSCSLPYPGIWPDGWMLGQLSAGYVNSSGTCGNAITNGSYQWGGKLYGFVAFPSSATLTNVGGSGHEFDDGTGTNQNECQQNQCPGSGSGTDYGFGATPGFINPIPSDSPMEPGSWRIEEAPPLSTYSQTFFNVLLATDATDTNVPTKVTPSVSGSAPSRTFTTSWTNAAATCTYTIGMPENGVGGTITVQGSGCSGDGSVVVN